MPSVFVLGPDAGILNTRRLNRQRLLEAIRRLGPISRADLAKRTHLSPPTVSALVEELVGEAGLLREVGVGASSGGRPPILLEFNADYGCLAGVDLGSRTARFALADLQGHVLARHQERTRADSCDAAIDQVMQGIEALFRKAGRDLRKLFAIGIGAPGMTDVTTGRVISAANLAGWTNVPLRDMVEARFHAPVHVDNDANMAALGERWQGAARTTSDFVFLALGAGVGAGVVIGGRLHRGHHWYAGEISRMTLDYRDWQVDFGQSGYLESRIGAAAIPEWAHARRLFARAGQDREACVRMIIDAARQGDADAAAVVDELAVFLGTAVANIVAVLDPGLVVIGGGLSHAGDLLLEPVRRVVRQIVPNVPAIEISALGDDAQLLGSVYSAMEAAEARLFAIAGSPGMPPQVASRASSR
ncbi:MAG TPA: ROK family transcriptional regulator [Vicinamibacterales bacterium]|nr:ROK family transcriptional regulator [Vicinamibacterales bacterium]